MTYKQIAQMVASIGVPYAYYQFPNNTPQNPPFICFFYTQNNDVVADDSNYQKVERLAVELYTDNKDFSLESAVENALTANGLVYTREETHLDSERMYEVIFTTEIVINTEVNDNG